MFDKLYKILYDHIKRVRIMAIKFYESPFHAIEEPDVATKSVLTAILIMENQLELGGNSSSRP